MGESEETSIVRYIGVVPAQYGDGLGDKLACVDKVGYRKNGDSKQWYTRCDCCFKIIDRNTDEECFVSEDLMLILCNDCYTELKKRY